MGAGILNTNLIITSSGLAISILGLFQVCIGFRYNRKTKRFFLLLFSFIIAYIGMNLLEQLTDSIPGAGNVPKVAMFFESTFSSVLMLILSGFLLDSCGIEKKRHPLLITSVILWVIYMGLLIFTQFTTVIYYYDENNAYNRGPWYQILLIPPVLLMLVNIIALILLRKKLSPKQRLSFAAYLLLPLISMLIQMIFYGIYVIVLGTAIAAFFMLSYNLMDQTERYYRKEAENQKLKMDILVAEVRPHFIFNSLTAIRSCLDEPEKAEEALNHFTGFLRSSIDVLEETECITAAEEFRTVDHYLYLSRERFGDKLTVIREIKEDSFRLPSFSVETLVENAVRHGIRKNKGGRGTLTIRSFRKDAEYVVEVEDDGVGFSENEGHPGDEHSHVGLPNLRKRLKFMCNGRLEIESEPGKGTLARICIPVSGNER